MFNGLDPGLIVYWSVVLGHWSDQKQFTSPDHLVTWLPCTKVTIVTVTIVTLVASSALQPLP